MELFVNFEDYVIQRYDWLEPCHGHPKCEEFKEALLIQFGTCKYENVNGELVQIQQTTIVIEYQGQFEQLSDQARDLS